MQDSRGHIWLGTYRGGINLVEKTSSGNLKFIHQGNRLTHHPKATCLNVRCLSESNNGTILVGSTEGLLTFSENFKNPEEISFYHNRCENNRYNCLSNNDVTNICQSNNNIYISTYSGGINLTTSTNLLSEQIEFQNINKTNGLLSDISLSVIEDREGFIWITSVNSICRFHPGNNTFENFTQSSLNTDFEITEARPLFDSSGNLVLGTTNGALRIMLSQIQKSSFIPPIVFTDVRIQNNERKNEHKAQNIQAPTLSSSERNISISFAALDYSAINTIQYAYRLKGAGDQWIKIDRNHTVDLVNIQPGNYTFQVKSTNSNGIWMENIASIPIYITPTFWETGWAWTLYVLIFMTIICAILFIFLYILNLRRQVDFEQQMAQLKLNFFTDISHELRTPLTLISSPIDEVINNEPLTESGMDNMKTAKRNADRMLRLINQILDFRKIQSNKMKLYIERVDVITITNNIFRNFSAVASQKQINFQLFCNVDHHEMYTDVDKLEKILFNLLSNAFKYTPNGKSISLTCAVESDELQIKVMDEGTGFDIRKIDTLFSRFETSNDADPSISTGIGLSLVKELVSLLHGKINVQSIKGKGSTFTIKIPGNYQIFLNDPQVNFTMDDKRQSDRQEVVYETTDTPPTDHKTSILIIEDNEELRHFTKSILSKEYKILEAPNGKIGLDITLNESPDIVISDIMMPEMDGIEYLHAIKTNHDISHTPVILLTAKSSLDDRIQGLDYGADDYISKPFSSSYLKAKIQSLLKQRELLRDYYLTKNDSTKIQTQPGKEWQPSVPKITHFDDEFICNVIKSIEENIDNPDFKIDDLANAMCMSRAVFYRKVKSIVGLSPIDFVIDMRIKRAAQLLEVQQFSVSDVAYKCGFSTPQYLSRVFKDIMKCSPTEYKQRFSSK